MTETSPKKIINKIGGVFRRRKQPQVDLEDYIARQQARGYTGALQHVDPTPVAPPIGYKPRDSIFDQVKAMVEARLSELADQEQESFEEADDFEIDEPWDVVPRSPYENDMDPSIKELLDAGHKSLASKAAKKDAEGDPAARTAPAAAAASPGGRAEPGATPPADL